MRAALSSIVPYRRPVAQKSWPVAAADDDAETAQASMRRAVDFFELADEVGLDLRERVDTGDHVLPRMRDL